MNTSNNEKELRELVRQIEAKLGILNEMKSSCCGVSFTQCHAITEIGRACNISLNELAERLNVDNSTMSRNVNNIVFKGLANRELDKNDRRYVTISLTEDGKNMYDKIELTMNNYFKKIYENIPQDKREQVVESLELLSDAITKNVCCNKE